MKRLIYTLTLFSWACASSQVHHPQSAAEPEVSTQSSSDSPRSTPSDTRIRRAPTSTERDAIEDLFKTAERVRRLRFMRPVPVEIHDRNAMIDYLTSEIEDHEVQRAKTTYYALGLLDANVDIRDLLTRVLGEQVVGYYDPETSKLVVRDDVMRSFARTKDHEGLQEAKVVLVHEMVHALQDQHLGLGRVYEIERDTDPEDAFRGLVEGDATLAMFGYVAELGGQPLEKLTHATPLLRQMLPGGSSLFGPELQSAPAILRVSLVSAYLQGMLFCAELHKQGGWRAVDQAHSKVPISSEQIIHPQKYLNGEGPEAIAIPALSELQTAGLHQVDEDSLGELELSVYLGQLEQDGMDERAAEGWDGDRIRIYEGQGTQPSVVWFTAWDNEASARRVTERAQSIADRVTAQERATHRIERMGRAVLIVRWLEPSLHSHVKSAFSTFARTLRTTKD